MEVKARAPGKIILSGEHAVVHGSTAVAASISLHTFVSLAFPSHSGNDDTLKLQLKDMALEFSWPIGRIKEALAEFSNVISSSPTSCTAECLRSIGALVEEQNIPEAKIGLSSGLSAFLWLYSCIQGFKPATVVVTSELPIGSGLGSSAAFCVALSAALLALSDSVSVDVSHKGWSSFGEKELDLLNRWALEGEKIIHGKPSGIDNAVSTYGNLIKFKSGSLNLIKSSLPLKMLITNTKEGRNTKALVAGVSERTIRHHDVLNFIFNAVDFISKELSAIIESPVSDEVSIAEKEDCIAELMENESRIAPKHGGEPCFDRKCSKDYIEVQVSIQIDRSGRWWLWSYIVADLVLSGTIVDKVVVELESCGFQCLIAEIGGRGVEVCFDEFSRTDVNQNL